MHHITEFKGFKDVSIDLIRPFTLLIGPNGSGKTNVIEAIELLSFIARGQPLYEIANVGRTETGRLPDWLGETLRRETQSGSVSAHA